MEYHKHEVKPVLPEGAYRVKILAAEEKVSKSGKQMIEVKCQILTGELGDMRMLYYYIVEGPMAHRNLSQMAKSLGLELPEGHVNPEIFLRREGGVRVVHDEWNGETRAKIYYFLSPKQTEDALPRKKDDVPF